MIRAAFFDIDHTLFSHSQKRIPQSTWEALEKLKEKGLRLYIATGRQYHEMLRLDEDWFFFDGFVTLNGTLSIERSGEVISSFPFTGEGRRNIERIFCERTMPLLVVEADRMYTNTINDTVLQAQQTIGLDIPQLGTITDNDIYQLIFYAGEGEEDRIMASLGCGKASRWNDYAFDVTREESGKDKGIESVLAKYSIAKDECLVFGDGDNDVSMLSAFPNSVAMGNARESAKAAASFITSDVDDDGIARALEHFGLI